MSKIEKPLDALVDDLWDVGMGHVTDRRLIARRVFNIVEFLNELKFNGQQTRPFQFYVDRLREVAQ